MTYILAINDIEKFTIIHIAKSYNYALSIIEALDSATEVRKNIYRISEHEAWNIKYAIDIEDGWLPLMGENLKHKFEYFLDRIV